MHANQLDGEVSMPRRVNVSPGVEAEFQSTMRSHSLAAREKNGRMLL